MRKCNYLQLFTFLILYFSGLVADAQVRVSVALLPNSTTYEVSLLPEASYAGVLGLTNTAQVTIKVPTGGFTADNVNSSLGNWPSPTVFVSPAEAPNFDYLVFTNSGNFGHDYVSGEEVMLFTFENIGNCTGPAEIMLLDDPFINNASANVGPAFAILGFGNSNAFAGAYEVGNANCSGGGEDCGSSVISNVFSVNERSCEGNDGTIQITASGGNSSLEYSIDNGGSWSSSFVFNNVAPGDHFVRVRESNNPSCETAYNFNPVIIAAYTVNIILVQQAPSCSTNTDGSISIGSDSQDAALQYSIDNGQTFSSAKDFTGLGNGTYNIIIKESGGCEFGSENNPLVFNSTTSCTSSSDSDGDGVPDAQEDLNQDGDFTNDDTDGDGIPNFLDSDDDGDRTPTSIEEGAPNGGDGNGDGVPDCLQNAVTSQISMSGTYHTLSTGASQPIFFYSIVTEAEQAEDTEYNYPYDLDSYVINSTGSVAISIYYHGVSDISNVKYRKYGPTQPGGQNFEWYDYPHTLSTTTVGSSTVALVQLTLTDNQLGDSDITVGRIVDPGGLAVVQAACDVRYLLTESNGVYQVSMQSNVTYTGLDNIIASMQVALRAPTGEIQVDESCILDTYGNTSFVVSTLNSPAETPAYDYITFNINEAFSSDITFTAGETVPLFTFKNGTDCSNGGVLELIGPEGVTPPNLAGNNIAPQLSTSGGGADQPVCVDATTAPINCTTNSGGNTGGNTGNSSNCDITYVLSESNGIYQVSIDSDVTYTGSDNIIASMQVSLRVPTGTFEVVNGSISDTYNNTDFLVSMVTSPSETPTYDYINFTIDGSISTEIPFTAGQLTPLFTFSSTDNCTEGGVLELIGTDGIAAPILAGNNVGSQLSTSGGGVDQPVCVDATAISIVCPNNGGNTGGNTGNTSDCDVTYVLTESNGSYQVSIESNVTYTGINNTIASMQVSLRVPTGTFEVDNSCVSDTYANTDFFVSTVSSPSETPTFDYINFTIDGSTSSEIPFTAGQTTPLFTFKSTSNCTSGGLLELIGMGGIATPTLAGNNVGSQLSTAGGGIDQPICVDATTVPIVCSSDNNTPPSNCDVTYLLTETNGVYQVSMESNVTYTGINNTIASMQVSLRAPAGVVTVDESCILDTHGNTEYIVSRVPSPPETPNYDYFNFTIDGSTSSDIFFVAGQTLPLFSFKNIGDCNASGIFELVGTGGVPIPNLANNNVASQLSTLGGGIDQPICVDAAQVPIVCSSDTNTPSSDCDVTYVLTEANGIYQVNMESNVTYTGSANTVASMQVSIRAPAGVFEVDEDCIVDTYANTEYIVSVVPSPSETPAYDYINFTIDGSTSSDLTFTAGQSIPLFSFKNRGTCSGNDVLELVGTGGVPIPNLANNNVASQLSTVGGGIDQPICVDATAIPIVCSPATCDVTYILEGPVDGIYTMKMLSHRTYSTLERTISTMQITIQSPTGALELDNNCIVETYSNTVFELASEVINPAATPGFDYHSFSLTSFGTNQIPFVTGDTVILFTFKSLQDCSITGDILLVGEGGVPIPTISTNNLAPQLFILGGGGEESSVCVDGSATPIQCQMPCPEFSIDVIASDMSDCGASDGQIVVNVTPSDGVIFSIDNGATWQTNSFFSSLAVGTYDIVIAAADTTCQVVHGSVTLIDQIPPTIGDVDITQPATCDGTGMITIAATGTNGVIYSIDGGNTWSTTGLFSDVGTGNYDITIANADTTCVIDGGEETLSGPASPVILDEIIVPPTGCETSTGFIQIPTIPATGLLFSIDGGATWTTTNVFSELGTGTYNINVATLDTSCITIGAVVEFTELATPVINDTEVVAPTTCGGTDGQVTITSSPSTGLIYSIDGGATWSTNNVFSGLSSNIYLISIAYADTLCEVSGTPINLSDPSAPIVNVVTPTNPSICGGTDGQITINSTPATGLIYSVDGGNIWSSNNTFTGLTAGFYSVQVAFSDTTCMVIGTPVSLEDPTAPTVTNISSDDPMTCGSADGQITINSSPATGLLYSIDGGSTWNTTNNFTGLNAGFYSIRLATLDTACVVSGPALNLENPADPVLISATPTQPTQCDGGNGQIVISSFPVSGIIYSIDGGATWSANGTFVNVASGSYDLRLAYSDTSCIVPGPVITIDNIPEPTFTSALVGNCIEVTASCEGDFEYSLDGITYQPSNMFCDLPDGSYTARVRCRATGTSQERLIGFIDNKLVEVDLEDVSLSEISSVAVPANSNLYNLTFSLTNNVFYAVVNSNDILRLVSIDLAGNYTEIGEFNLAGETIFGVEALAYNEFDNKLYASVTLDGEDFHSEAIIEVNVQDASSILISTLVPNGTFQTDIDNMTFINNELWLHDGVVGFNNTSIFYNLSFNGLGNSANPTEIANRQYEPVRDMSSIGNIVYFSTSNFDFFSLDTETGIISLLGQTHTNAEFNGNPIEGLGYARVSNFVCFGETNEIVINGSTPAVGCAIITNPIPNMTLCEAGSTPVSMTLDSPIASYIITGGTFANDAIVQDTILQFDANLDGLINFFTVTIQTQTGCEIVEEFVLYQAQNTEADFVVIEPFCKDGEVTIQFTGTATPIATLNWDLGEDGVIVNQSGNTTEPPNSVITASWPSEGSKLIGLEVDDNGCTDDHVESIFIRKLPLVTVIPDTTICLGDCITLDGDGTGVWYTWSPADGLSATDVPNPTACPTTTTTYTLDVMGADGCVASTQVTVMVEEVDASTSPDTTICIGTTAFLNATGGVNYSWSPVSGLSSPTIPNPIANPSQTTTYTVTVTNDRGCTTEEEVTVTVEPLPSVFILGDPQICEGEGAQLSASVHSEYSWSPAESLSSSTISDPIATPTTTTTYFLTVTSAAGCTSTSQYIVEVLPAPTAVVGPDQTICPGQNVLLNASGGVAYDWSPTTNLINATSATPTVSPSSPTAYTVTVTSANGCTDEATVNVDMESFEVTAMTSRDLIAPGEMTKLSVDDGGRGVSYSWSPTGSLNDPNIAMPEARPASTTEYCVTVTDAEGCMAVSCVIVEVDPNTPPANCEVNAGGDVTICGGGSIQLIATGSFSYTWSPSAGLSNPNIANPTAAPSQTTTYTVTGTSENGCISMDEVTVFVAEQPNIITYKEKEICRGDSVRLLVNIHESYAWSPTNTMLLEYPEAPLVFPSTTTIYTVTVTNASGCTNTEDIRVEVQECNNRCQVEAGSSASICEGESITLNGSGAVSYQWSPTTGLSNATIANPVASPSQTTQYTVTGTDATGCISTDEVTIFVNPKPTIITYNEKEVCFGESIQLLVNNHTSYNWSPTNSLDLTTPEAPIATPTANTDYFLTVTDNNGCTNTDVISVTVLFDCTPGVPCTVNAGPDVSICQGQSIFLQGSGAVSYNWTPTAGLNNANTATPLAFPTVTTTYTITGTDADGSTCTDQVTVFVSGNRPTAIACEDKMICQGDSIQMVVNNHQGYSWAPSGSLTGAMTGAPMASPTTTTTYTVTVTNADGCTDTDQVTIFVEDCSGTPPVCDTEAIACEDKTICSGETVQLVVTTHDAYSWGPTNSLSGANTGTPLANPTTTTTYTVTVTDANGCTDTDQVTVFVEDCSGTPPVCDIEAIACEDKTICSGESIQLVVNTHDAYAWSPASSLSGANTGVPMATPTITTTYTVTVTDANGCTDTDQVTVFVENCNTPPLTCQVDAGENITICQGQSMLLNGSGAVSYSWSPNTGISNANTATPLVFPTATTTYTLLGITADGSFCEDQVTVFVGGPRPEAVASEDQTICEGESAQLVVGTFEGYAWAPTASLTNANTRTPIAAPTGTTTYTVTVTNADGCTDTDHVTVFVENCNTPPPATCLVNAGEDISICQGQSMLLQGSGALSYSWTPSTAINNATTSNPLVFPTQTTTYTVTGTMADGSTCTDQITVFVGGPRPQAVASEDQTICEGESAQLVVSTSQSYAWAPTASLTNANTRTPIAAPTGTTTYIVTVTNADGCTDTDQVTVFVENCNTPPSIPTNCADANFANAGSNVAICPNESITLLATGGTNYTWSPADGLSNPNIANPTANPSSTTVYTVTVTDANGCTDMDDIQVLVSLPIMASIITTEAGCCGEGGGSIVVNASGGFGNLTYNWGTSELSGSVLSNLEMGNYTVTITDIQGCSLVENILVGSNCPACPTLFDTERICSAPGATLAEVCLPILPADIEDYIIRVDGVQVNPFHGCAFENITSYSYAILPELAFPASFRVESWTINGVVHSIDIMTISDLTNWMNEIDREGFWILDHNELTLVGGIPIATYGPIKIVNLEDWSEAILQPSIVGRATGTLLEVDVSDGKEHQVVIEYPSLCCREEIIVHDCTLGQPCLDDMIAADLLELTTNKCGEVTSFCIEIPPTEITNYTILQNGIPYEGEIVECLFEGNPGSSFIVEEGSHEFIFENTINGCQDRLLLEVECPENIVVDTILEVGATGILCITDFFADSLISSVKQTCLIGGSDVLAIEQSSDYCWEYTGLQTGMERFCIEVCTTDGICQNVIQVVNVIPAEIDCPPINIAASDSVEDCMQTATFCVEIPFDSMSVYAMLLDGQAYRETIEPCGQHLQFNIPVGTHILELIHLTTGCKQEFTFKVSCNPVLTELSETISKGDTDTLCLDMSSLPGSIISIENICPDSAGTVATFEWEVESQCIFYKGLEEGKAKACLVVCDNNGICDTIELTVIVIEDIPMLPDAISDSLATEVNIPVTMRVIENDEINGNLRLLEMTTYPTKGELVMNDDFTITYIPENDYCELNNPQIFEYRLCNEEGCDTAFVTVCIPCQDFEIKTGFSPNADGVNDVFYIQGLQRFPNNELQIFNRWGSLVYQAKGYKNDWTGSFEEQILPSGTYFYLLTLGDGSKPMEGYLHIRR